MLQGSVQIPRKIATIASGCRDLKRLRKNGYNSKNIIIFSKFQQQILFANNDIGFPDLLKIATNMQIPMGG